MGRIKTTAELELIAGSTLSSTSTGSTTINSGTGAMGISTDASATAVNIATGANTKTINIGNNSAATAVDINTGSAGSHLNLTTNGGDIALSSSAGSININSTTGSVSISNSSSSNTVVVGTGAGIKMVTVGSTNTTSATVINCGTGNLTVSSASGTLISQLSTGAMTRPLQPAFLALGGAVNDVTGNGTAYTWGSSAALTEVFDQGGNFNTNGTFTAPVTGQYLLCINLMMTGMDATMTGLLMVLITSNRSYNNRNGGFVGANTTGQKNTSFSVIADMDSGDTATITITVTGGAGNTADVAAGTANSCWSGCLMV